MYKYVPTIIDVHTIYKLCLSIHDIDKNWLCMVSYF